MHEIAQMSEQRSSDADKELLMQLGRGQYLHIHLILCEMEDSTCRHRLMKR